MFREGYIVLAQGIVVRPEIILGLMGLLTSTNLLRLILLPSPYLQAYKGRSWASYFSYILT